jgi:hypothetical protein
LNRKNQNNYALLYTHPLAILTLLISVDSLVIFCINLNFIHLERNNSFDNFMTDRSENYHLMHHTIWQTDILSKTDHILITMSAFIKKGRIVIVLMIDINDNISVSFRHKTNWISVRLSNYLSNFRWHIPNDIFCKLKVRYCSIYLEIIRE